MSRSSLPAEMMIPLPRNPSTEHSAAPRLRPTAGSAAPLLHPRGGARHACWKPTQLLSVLSTTTTSRHRPRRMLLPAAALVARHMRARRSPMLN